MIEEFKEWKINKQHEDNLSASLTSAYWLIVTAIYLYVSFTQMIWHYSWIIFIIASALFNIVKALVALGRRNDA